MFHRALFVVFLIVCSTSGLADAAPDELAYEDVFANFRFPPRLGSFRFQNRVQYPRVDLGYGLNYAERSGATATIIVYDMNQREIANGTFDNRVHDEFAKIGESIAAVAQQGGYREVHPITTAQLSKAWLQTSHQLVRVDGRTAYAYSFIRGQNSRFVKIRITMPSQRTFENLPLFLLDVSRAIGMLNDGG